MKRIGLFFLVVAFKVFSAQVTVTDNSAPAANVGPGSKTLLVGDITLSTGVGGNLTDITFKNTGNAASPTDILNMRFWVDAGAPGWSGDDTLLGTAIWDSINSDWVVCGLIQPCDNVRFFVTVDITNSPTDDRTIQLQIPALSDSLLNGIFDPGDEGIFLDTGDDGPAILTTSVNIQTIHSLKVVNITDSTTTNKLGPGTQNALAFNFVIPDNAGSDDDGQPETLTAISVRTNTASNINFSDISNIKLWLDNGNNTFEPGADTNLGAGSWDGDSWVWSGLSAEIPTGGSKRFFVSIDITSFPASNDNAIILFEIPKLVDSDNDGAFDTNDEGIFVASSHEGPTDADFISTGSQTIHIMKLQDLVDYTVSSEFGAGSANNLFFDFVIPDNDGGTDTLQALVVGLASTSTALISDISRLRLWKGGINVATATLTGSLWVFSGLSSTILPGGERFSITGDIISNPSADNVVIVLEILKLVDNNKNGDFDANDKGIFVASLHDGPIDGTFTSRGTHTIHCLKLANISGTAPTRYFYAGEQDVLVMDITITPEERDEVLNSLIIENQGTGENGTEAQRVELWVDGPSAGWNGDETNLGMMGWNSGGTWSISGLTQQVLKTETRFFVAIDAANSARAQRTIIMRIPLNGINMASFEDGPVDGTFTNSGIQTVKGKISINPTSGYVNDIITVSGSGFDETENIEIDFGNTINIAGTTTANAQFIATFTVNTQTPGTVVITARGLVSGEFATTTFFLNRVVFEITKTVDKNGVEAGDFLNYTISYRNIGNISATNALLYDYFPTATTYATHSEIAGAPFPAYHDSSHIKWYLGTVSAGSDFQSATLKVKFGIPLEYGSFIRNRATATADQPASYAESNLAETMVISLPSLVGDISVVPDTMVVFNGWKLLFTINYRNIGSATTAGTTTIHIDEDKENLRDIVPSGNGVYDPNSSIIWEIGSIPPGSGGSVTFTATVFGVPGDTITVTGYIQDGFHLDLSMVLSIQSEFSSEWYDWLMFHHNLGRTGYNDGTQDFSPPFGEKWRNLIGGQNDDIRSSPAILEGALYTGGLGDLPAGGWFYRLNANDGTVIWKYNTGGEVHSSPAIANNGQYVYVGNADGRFYCFSGTETFVGTDSKYIWMFDTLGGEIYSSPVVWKGLVYFTAKRQQKGYVYCLSGVNGAPAWIKPLDDQFFYSSPAISEKDNLVYVGDENGVLWALDAFLGSITWKYDTGAGPISSSPVYKDGVVYIACEDGKMYALDSKGSSTGSVTTLLWSYNVNSPIKSTPAFADNALFFGADDSYIYAINPPTTGTQTGTETLVGSIRWKYKTNGPVVSSPAVAGGVVYVGSKDGYLYEFDIKYGTLTWSYKLGNSVMSSPAIARRMLYVASGDGNVYAFERKPNFSLSKSALPSSGVNPGATLTYILNFKNTGYVGSGVYVVDQLDSNLGTPTITCISMGTWSYSSTLLRWDVGTVSSQDYGTLTFDCQVSQSANGTITNSAVLYCNELPSISTSTRTPINYLSLKKFVSSSYVEPSGTLTYTIEYKSPIASLNDLVIEDVIPGSVTYVFSSAKGEGMSILYSHNGVWNEFDNSPVSAIKWTRLSLGAGYIGTVSFKAIVDSSVDDGRIITNVSFATATTNTGSLTGTSAVSSFVTSGPVIEMAKCVNGLKEATATYLSVATYTISYSAKLKNASGVEIVDKIPSGVSYISGSAMGSGTIRYSSDGINYYLSEISPVLYIKWELGNLDKGSSGTSSFSVMIGDLDDGYIIKNYATSTSLEKGPFTSNSSLIIVLANPKLTLTKTTDVASTAGGTLTYTLSYFNSRKDASDVVITDGIPGSVIYISKSATGSTNIEYGTDGVIWSDFETNPVNYIKWTIGNLNKGSSGVVSFKAQILSQIDDGVIIENIATITANNAQAKTATCSVFISSLPILTIEKIIDMKNSYLYPGGTLTYIINFSNYLKQATNVVIIDTLSQETTYSTGSTIYAQEAIAWYSHDGGGNYDQNPMNPITHIKWIIAKLDSGKKGSITLKLRIKNEIKDGTIVTNRVSIKSDEVSTSTAEASIYVSSKPDFSQSIISVTPTGTVSEGWFIKYEITCKNTGNVTAEGVSIKADTGKYLTNITIGEVGTISNGIITWNIGTVSVGGEGKRTFSAYIKKPILLSDTIVVSVTFTGSNVDHVVKSVISSLALPINSESDEWPMLGFSPSHSSYNPKEFIITQKLGLVGSVSLSGQIFAPPVINNNRVYVGCKGNRALYSFTEEGKEIWNYPARVYSTPAIAENKIFFTDEDGYLNFLNEEGSLTFRLYIGSGLSSPAVVNGIVYITSSRAIFAISAFDGTMLWSYTNINGNIYSSPAISNGILYIGTDEGNVYLIDQATGELKASCKVSGGIYSSLAIDKDIAYFGARDGRLYGIKQSGTGTIEALNLNLGSPINCIPAIYNDTIYIGADNKRLYAIDISGSGTIKWEFSTGGRIKSQCAIANTLFFTSEDGYLYSLNLDNGEMLFSWNIGVGRGVSLANTRVYAVSDTKLWIFGSAPNLSAAMSSNPSEMVVSCGTITYTIKYENKGKASAIDTNVMAYLDSNLQTPFDISNFGTYSDITRTITWKLGTISESEKGILTFKCQTYATRTTKMTVYGEIKAQNNPPSKTNSVVNTVGDAAHLILTIAPSMATTTLNEIITYNVQYLNSGDFPAYNVNIIVNKPDWTTYISNSTRLNGVPLSDINSQSPLFSGIFISRLEGLVGGSITFNLKVNINCPNGTILNTSGTISAQGIFSTNTALVLIETASLSGSESVSPSLVRPGNSVIYTISYENRGSRSAYNLIITEKLSQDLATTFLILKNGIYDPIYHIITWNLGELKPGEVGSITFNAKPNSVLNNGLVVRNNVYMEATNILRFEILQATLTIESGPNLTHSTKDVTPKAGISLGSVIRYDINVSNTGNMDAEGVMVYDKLPPSISVSQLETKGEVVSGDSFLDIDDINGWSGFDNGGVDGIITIVTNQGTYRSSLINTFNYPSIQSLMTEINNDTNAGSKISYDSTFDRFTILSPAGGCIMTLQESGAYPFFSAIKIETGAYCTGSWTNGVISWNLGKISGYGNLAISFSAQVVGNGQIINYATITSANHSTITTNMVEITVDKNPPTLIGRPKEDSSDLGGDYDGIDDDADIDGVYRVVFPVESEPCGLIEYEIAEKIGTNGSWVIMGTSQAVASFYEVSTRTKGLTYTYRIRARNTAGWGNWSNSSDGIKIVDGAKVVLSINETDVFFSPNLLVRIPKGAFPGTVTFTIQRKDIGIMVASPGISSILPNSVYEFLAIPEEYSEGTQPLKPLTLVLPYNDPDETNETDDLSYRIYKLIGAQWVLVDGTQIVSSANNTVQCSLNSLSIYCVGSPIGLSLSDIVIKPNPFKGNKHTEIIFYYLSGDITISIYNIAGELIFKKEHIYETNWHWNLLNDNNEKVASGVYFALIDDGEEKVIRRFAIIK